MGKIVKTILATEDNDPMGLLGNYDIFTPKKIKYKKIKTRDLKNNKLIKKNNLK